MKILLCAQQGRPGWPLPPYAFWAEYFRRGIEEAGHTWSEVPQVDWAEGLTLAADAAKLRAWRASAWTRTLAAAKGHDFLLGYFFPAQIEPQAVAELARRGLPAVNFFCDHVREFRRGLPAAFQPFALHWVPEAAALELYARAGWSALAAPMPCWIPPADRRADWPERHGPTFVGSSDRSRRALFADLARTGSAFTVRGRGWTDESNASDPAPAPPARSLAARLRHQAEFVAAEGPAGWARAWRARLAPAVLPAIPPAHRAAAPDGPVAYADCLRSATVTLGVNRYDTWRVAPGQVAAYSRLRDIEAPMLGCCYLTESCPGLDTLYDCEQEIAVYHHAEDLAAQLARLQADPARRRRLREAGQRRALADHTVARSLQRIAARLGRT